MFDSNPREVCKLNVLSAGVAGIFVHGLIGLASMIGVWVVLLSAYAIVAANSGLLPSPVSEEQLRLIGVSLIGGAAANVVTGVLQVAAGGFFAGIIAAWVYNVLQGALGRPRLQMDVVEHPDDQEERMGAYGPNPLLPTVYRATRIDIVSAGWFAMWAYGVFAAFVGALLVLATIPLRELMLPYAEQSPIAAKLFSFGPVWMVGLYVLFVGVAGFLNGFMNGALFAIVYNWGQSKLPDKRLKVECYSGDHAFEPAWTETGESLGASRTS